MVSKTLAKKKKKAVQEKLAKEGVEPKKVTEATKGHMAHGKLQRMRHGLKKKRKYRIGTATAHDIYENFDKPLGDVKCDAAKAALAEAAKRKVEGKKEVKKVVKRVVKTVKK
eukprot:TRINITY_DN6548_c0_g1_i1.p2 TRINITY_DN6548_c0_g1~~TRINITY_DN6548_c0_g1_i1.p2  ORF type:complete len:123 (+),score=58.18 TRINITY_DN6548_c0_g1_i1:35-370(+)